MKSIARETTLLDTYREFCGRHAIAAMSSTPSPATSRGWDERLDRIRHELKRSLGRMPDHDCALDAEVLGTIERDGYAIERLTFQSRPGVRVTANIYRPSPARDAYPAMLSVHGHWAWARLDPHVQPRCIGLAKLGYVVLSIDAFGAGERAIQPGSGTYHGALTGASLWPLGTPLVGLQVYDNRRAVDYLMSRSDVDPAKLAITGASGGGNQSLYAGVSDPRLKVVIPVCGIGTYEANLNTACCVCEVNPGGARYATTGDLLAMIAPRPLLVISATQDALQFSVAEAAKSIAYARPRFRLLGAEEKLRHVFINSGHDYNQPMREAMYGWVELWLKGRGNGNPVAEPQLTIEDVATLKCYPEPSLRPRTVATIPEFARVEWESRQKTLSPAPDHKDRWIADAERMRATLRDRVLGPFPPRIALEARSFKADPGVEISIVTENGIRARARSGSTSGLDGTAILTSASDEPSKRAASATTRFSRVTSGNVHNNFATLEILEPRGTGAWLSGSSPVVGIADHTVAEWGVWVDRPLLAQWVWDLMRWVDFLEETAATHSFERLGMPSLKKPYILVADGAMGIPAILTAALDRRVAAVSCSNLLVTYVGQSGKPWSGLPMGLLAPNILEVGDVDRLAALVAPRQLSIESGVEPEGYAVDGVRLNDVFGFTRSVFAILGANAAFSLGRDAKDPLP